MKTTWGVISKMITDLQHAVVDMTQGLTAKELHCLMMGDVSMNRCKQIIKLRNEILKMRKELENEREA